MQDRLGPPLTSGESIPYTWLGLSDPRLPASWLLMLSQPIHPNSPAQKPAEDRISAREPPMCASSSPRAVLMFQSLHSGRADPFALGRGGRVPPPVPSWGGGYWRCHHMSCPLFPDFTISCIILCADFRQPREEDTELYFPSSWQPLINVNWL